LSILAHGQDIDGQGINDETKFALAAYPVDGKPTYAFHFQCTSLSQPRSSLCGIHHDVVVESLAIYVPNPTGKDIEYFQPDAEWKEPLDTELVKWVHESLEKFVISELSPKHILPNITRIDPTGCHNSLLHHMRHTMSLRL
jgi:hypothetical protein